MRKPSGQIVASVLLLIAAYVFLVQCGLSIQLSIAALVSPSESSGGGGISGEHLAIRWGTTLVGVAAAAAAAAAAVGAAPTRSGQLPPPSTYAAPAGGRTTIAIVLYDLWHERTPAWWWRAAATAGLYGLASAVSNWINIALQGDHTAAAAGIDTSTTVWAAVAEAAAAGLGEEVILVAALIVVLERTGLGFRWILMIGVAARLAFHVHYGPGMIGLAIWAVAALIAYRWWRSIIPMIVIHTWHDIAALWPNPGASWWLTAGALWTIPAVLAVVAATTYAVPKLRPGPRRPITVSRRRE